MKAKLALEKLVILRNSWISVRSREEGHETVGTPVGTE
jgi:hypothetical protein